MLNTNVNPYFDDYDALKNYIRILFKPGRAVQARELTQIQTALQHQITKFGDHVFKDGSMVIPGALSLNTEYDYVKLDAGNEVNYVDFDGTIITGSTSGVEAKVIETVPVEGSDPVTLYVKYTKSGTNNTTSKFTATETLTNNVNGTTATVNEVGQGSSVNIQQGVYFVSGAFVLVSDQRIILDKYTNAPTYSIGLQVDEQIATSIEDNSLLDNATGSPNFAAPGADRYEIKLTLIKQDYDLYQEVDTQDPNNTTISNFIQLMKVKDGEVRAKIDQPIYNELEKTLARRTFDESGNYTVRPFIMNMKEMNVVDNTYTNGALTSDDYLAAGLEPSKAYVQGYEVETHEIKYIPVRKARDETADVDYYQNAVTNATLGNYIIVNGVLGIPDTSNFSLIDMKDIGDATIGSCRVRSFEYNGNSDQYRLYLFDVQFNVGKSVSDLDSFAATDNSFTATLISGAEFLETSENSLVYKLPFDTIKDLKDEADNSDTTYVVKDTYAITLDGSGNGQISANGTDVFDEVNSTDWIAFIDSDGDTIFDTVVPLTSGTGTNQADIQVGNVTANVYLGATYAGDNARIIARTLRTAQPGTKTKQSASLQINTPITDVGAIEELAHADGLRVTGVWMSPNFSVDATTADVEVTENYIFDNGQKENYYDNCRIKHKVGTPTPTGRLLVQYEYFSHVGGDYFSVDSYPGDVAYEDIPVFNSKNGSIPLRDALDFRPRVADGGSDFTGTGSAKFDLPKPDVLIQFDAHYYLGRIDKLYVDSKGKFGIVEGVSSLSPKSPASPKDSMVLYTITINPYTFDTNDIQLKMIDNRRYTMRDIGKLENRIKNLEYYTTLSFLEKAAANREILDDTGSPRFKNGFLVDPFKGHNVANVLSQDHKCSIDKTKGELRPQAYSNNVKMMYDAVASGAGVTRTGPLVTLPYTTTPYVEQLFASESINVNPYNVFNWSGNIKLSPETDQWKDTETAPDVIVNENGLYDTLVANLEDEGALGTVWNEWETNWSGSEVETERSSSFKFLLFGKTTTTTTTTTTNKNQTRTGIETTVSPDTITTNIGNRVAEVNYIPFIRSRTVKFKATRLKPNTKVTPYFDGIDVTDWCATEAWVEDDFVTNTSAGDVSFNRSLTAPFASTDLVTDANGTIEGKFYIPNNSNVKFKTGKRVFKLVDTIDKSIQSTIAETEYFAEGLLETVENVSISTRVPVVERSEISEDRTTTSVSTSTSTKKKWIDPIAQTFLVDNPEGMFLTDMNLYFKTKDDNVPVTLQIRTTLNGYPTTTIVPFGAKTLNPTDVNVSADGSVATNFLFDAPIYLQGGVEYSFAVISNSNDYNMYIAKVGENDLISNKRITKQPYNGVLFKSQNGSTWTPDQTLDVKFVMNRASFTTNTVGNAVLFNDSIQDRYLRNNPIVTTNGSSVIKVVHPNHGMHVNSTVAIAGAAPTANQTDLNGVATGLVNTQHTIISVEHDSYKVDLGAGNEATVDGVTGNNAVTASQNYQYNLMFPTIQELIFPNTDMVWSCKTYSGKSIAGGESPKLISSTYTNMISNQNLIFSTPRSVYSVEEGIGDTLEWKNAMITTNEFVSPVIDLERVSGTLVLNRINNPSATVLQGFDEVDNFKDETDAVGGSALAKYVTKQVELANNSVALRVYLNVNRPTNSYVDLYYKTKLDGDDTPFEDLGWTLANPDKSIPFNNNTEQFPEIEYTMDNLSAFTSYAIKIVMRSSNTSNVPIVKDFRAIALGT